MYLIYGVKKVIQIGYIKYIYNVVRVGYNKKNYRLYL